MSTTANSLQLQLFGSNIMLVVFIGACGKNYGD